MSDRTEFAYVLLKRLVGITPATPNDVQEGQVRYARDGAVDGLLYVARQLSTGVREWYDVIGAIAGKAPKTATYITQTHDATLSAEQALGDLATGLVKNTTTTGVLSIAAEGTDYWKPGGTDVAVADGGTGASTAAGARTNLGAAATSHTHAEADVTSLVADLGVLTSGVATLFTSYELTLGPFYLNDVPGTATSNMVPLYFNTPTAVSQGGNRVLVGLAGEVVGAILQTDTARTAGTATLQVNVGGVGTAFNAGSVVLDGTSTINAAGWVAPGHGVAFTLSNTICPQIVTVGWTPTTADLTAWLICRVTV